MIRSCAVFTLTMLFSAALAAQTPAPAPTPPGGAPATPPANPPAAAAATVGAPTAAPAAEAVGDPSKGRGLTRMCEGCHGIEGWRTAFPEVYHVPKIGGQHAKYLAAALHEYKNGDRSHPSMRAIASTLSDEDIANVAAYYAQGVPPTLSAKK
jgi:cytochrome c553